MKLTILFLLLSSQVFASPDVIYGKDNRIEVYQSNNSALITAAESTAAMISYDNLAIKNEWTEISGPALKDIYRLCSKERFKEQLAVANCSGTLIDKDIILTAGHCFAQKNLDCKGYAWVFGYRVNTEKQSLITIPTSNIYKCHSVLAQQVDKNKNVDYAIIKLDRKVTDRKPVEIRLFGEISFNEKLAVIGHPRGLPTKIADSGDILESTDGFLRSNLDAYTMNSGSGVFNQKTGSLEGILVSGQSDFEQDASGCLKSRVLPESKGAEIITNVSKIWDLIDLF